MTDSFSSLLDLIKSNPQTLSRSQIITLLQIPDQNLAELQQVAYQVKKEHVGCTVYFRGLIELSNICDKDCFYCGIRKSNPNPKRYLMPLNEVIESTQFAMDSHYGSVVIQGGELSNSTFVEYVEKVIHTVKKVSHNELGITLSLGEQSDETFIRWKNAGAHRYLLRIESSNPKLYERLHPHDAKHNYYNRLDNLKRLQAMGWQTGTGVMMGLPGQTLEDLADDLLFMRDFDIDMIGMGPYIPHHETPLANLLPHFDAEYQLNLGLKMIALARLLMPDINIASTTALQSLKSNGRELGLLYGANVMMPNMTEVKYRKSYQLYDGKPNLDENAAQTQTQLINSIQSLGESIGFNNWGDSQHFKIRRNPLAAKE